VIDFNLINAVRWLPKGCSLVFSISTHSCQKPSESEDMQYSSLSSNTNFSKNYMFL
jgi:hypothetical protein